ncbi:ubiquitin carboxyl-terminal hydrolase 8-like [Gigantopelta aegis]|uniref:ubiquitin carboxyl-terminal hydrolase 8-like n=1 Tax=Gigantopelta aegis TaxID=1735272 RepID=UPI001B88BD1E|nr:ubiquitin carboxyl-terminal hydrolase 8-like [Gigantopelta aegis]
MPGKSSKKDLYLAKTLSDLNKFSEIKDLGHNVNVIIKSADKMYKEAERLDSLQDEERAYVLYMKYFNVIQQAKKKPDYKKQKEYFDSLIGKRAILKAIDRAEKLAESLKDRYDEVEAAAVAAKLSKLHLERDKKQIDDVVDDVVVDMTSSNTDKKPGDSSSNEEKENQSKTELTRGSITPMELYKLLQDKGVTVILMDVRSRKDFQESHISHPSSINIPEEIIKPGSTVSHIANALPSESVSLWKQRDSVDYIILLDWVSTEKNLDVGTTLRTLKDALFRYDSTVTLKTEPLILESGYEQWLLYYPVMSTNPRVSRPSPDQSVASMSGLDFNYPDLDEPKTVPPQVQMDQSEPMKEPSNQNVPHKSRSLPSVDRSLKPKASGSGSSISQNASHVRLNTSKTTLREANANSREKLSRIDNSLYPDIPGPVLSKDSLRDFSDSVSSKENTHSMRGMETVSNKEPSFGKQSGYPTETGFSSKALGTHNETGFGNESLSGEKGNSGVESGFGKDVNVETSSRIQQELNELGKIQTMKREELAAFQKEKQRMSLEHAARMSRLQDEQEKIMKLEAIRKKEERDVADLLRKKRNLQEQMNREETRQEAEIQESDLEEKQRLRELDHMKQMEAERKRRQEEVDRLRKERKLKEDEKKRVELEREVKGQEVRDQILLEIAEKTRQEEDQWKRELASAKEHAEKIRLADEAARQRMEEEKQVAERQRKSEEDRKKKEEEERRNRDAVLMKMKEDARRKQILKEQQEKEQREEEERKQREKEKLEREKMERLKKEADERMKAEAERRKTEEAVRAQQAKKIAEEKLRRINDPHPQSKIVPSTNMPVGWEKRLDRATNRYFYINHNNGTTQWEPPVLPTPQSGNYTTKLKDEPTASSSGLKRSFSSPDLMKINEQETFPSVDRAGKPAERFQTDVRPLKPVQRVVKRRDLNPIYGSVGSALTGLRNLGNTCYMNSTIQCLNNTSPLVSYFLTDNYYTDINRDSFQGMHGEVVDEFAVVLKALWSRQYRCITPRDLKLTVGKYNPMFAGYEQQDSQEFLTFLLDGLHEGLNEVKRRPSIPDQDNDNFPDQQAADLAWKNYKLLHRSIIVELFQGQLKSTLQCKSCGKQSKTFQTFMFLSVPIPSSSKCSLSDCIREFLKPERLTGDSKWRCPRCKVDRDATKKIDIWKLPPILLIGLNRFVRDGMWVQKTTSYVDFPLSDLELTDWVQGIKPKSRYNLYGVSNHYGTMEGGHYTAFCRNPESRRWHKFDDHEVYEMSTSEVKSPAAYFLYYTSIEMLPPSTRL